jgi:hypothetical protein
MRPSALSTFLPVLILSLAAPAHALAQWSVSLGVESERFWGGSLELGPERKSFRPYRPTVVGVGLERRMGKVGLGLRARYTEASLGLEGRDAVVALKGGFTVVGIAPEISYHIATLGPGNRLVLHAGPLVEFWDPVESDGRTRVGAQGIASLGIPLGGRFGRSVGGSLAFVASPFNSNELIDGYERRALWRRGFAAGLQYQL